MVFRETCCWCLWQHVLLLPLLLPLTTISYFISYRLATLTHPYINNTPAQVCRQHSIPLSHSLWLIFLPVASSSSPQRRRNNKRNSTFFLVLSFAAFFFIFHTHFCYYTSEFFVLFVLRKQQSNSKSSKVLFRFIDVIVVMAVTVCCICWNFSVNIRPKKSVYS